MGNVFNYDAMRAEKQNGKPDEEPKARTFTLAGQEFRIVDELPGIVQLEVGRATADGAPEYERLSLTTHLLQSCVHPEDWLRLDAVFHDPANGLRVEDVLDLTSRLLEVLTGRPTEPSSPSPGT